MIIGGQSSHKPPASAPAATASNTRRQFCSLLGGALVSLPFSTKLLAQAPSYIPAAKYNTSIHKTMQALESSHALGYVDDANTIFNRIINQAHQKLSDTNLLGLPHYNKIQAMAVCKIINKAIVDEGFVFDSNSYILSESIATKTTDCDMLSYMMLGVLEACSLDDKINLYACPVPGHMFLRWQQGQENFCCETAEVNQQDQVIQASFQDDSYYQNKYGFNPNSHFGIKSTKEILGKNTILFASRFIGQQDPASKQKTIDFHQKAIQLSPLDPVIRFFDGLFWFSPSFISHDFSMAKHSFQQSHKLGPNYHGPVEFLLRIALIEQDYKAAKDYCEELKASNYEKVKTYTDLVLFLLKDSTLYGSNQAKQKAYQKIALAILDKASAINQQQNQGPERRKEQKTINELRKTARDLKLTTTALNPGKQQ